MSKKIILVMSVLCLFACLMTACSKKTPDTPDISTPNESQTTEKTDEIINENDVNIETEEDEKGGEMQFIYGATSSKEKIESGNPETGDVVICDGYEYTYNIILVDQYTTMPIDMNGWSVHSVDKERKVAEGIKDELFGIPVKSMNYCYKGSEQLEMVKSMPKYIESAVGAFESCAKLVECCELPVSLSDARNMFAYCTSLQTAPQLIDTLKAIDKMFYYCRALTGHINIPDSIETFNGLFDKTTETITIAGKDDIVETITREYWNVSKK